MLGRTKPYEVMGKWALKGIVIGQAKKTGPYITISVINLSHAFNNRELINALKDNYVFGQEHSIPNKDESNTRFF